MSTTNRHDSGKAAPPCWTNNGQLDAEKLKQVLSEHVKKLSSSSPRDERREGAEEFLSLVNRVWTLETQIARDSADLIANELRTSGGLDSMLQLYTAAPPSDGNLQSILAKAMEQILMSANRIYLSEHKLCDKVIEVACHYPEGIGILENLMKVSADTCDHLISCGALESIILNCRSSDSSVTQHCAAALANCAMYGGHRAQVTMVSKHADHWLFPLAFSEDRVVKYYALIATCFLAANPDLNEKVAGSGTLRHVLPFLKSRKPEEFFRIYPINYAHGRSPGWLKKLLLLLKSSNEEARSLASFHFAMEAVIKKNQHRLQVFGDIGAIEELREAAKRGSRLTGKLCCQALATCDVAPPPYQCWDVLRWTSKNVSSWVEDIGLKQLAPSFEEHLVTGNILVDLTMEDLLEIGFQSKVRCKWFLEEIRKLRCLADVSQLDKDKVCTWLTNISAELAVYRVDFVRHGVTKAILPHLTDSELEEVGVHSKLNRSKILLALKRLPETGEDTPDLGVANFSGEVMLCSPSLTRKYDVFISYRRSGGSQLASLLKVHLQTRGITAFLDVYGLGGGNFDEALIMTISKASNFVIVLTSGALDRCKGDARISDWLHREIVCALEHKVNVVPIIDPAFEWPEEREIPGDIQALKKLNGVPWSHEFQDAAIQRLVDFLQLPVVRGRSGSRATPIPY